jgi:hypothetical protein
VQPLGRRPKIVVSSNGKGIVGQPGGLLLTQTLQVFAGLDEQMLMRIDTHHRPSMIRWSCIAHTRDDEWTGTQLSFELTQHGTQACELNFRHTGLPADLVADGWEHFLGSLAAYAEHGTGTPFGA